MSVRKLKSGKWIADVVTGVDLDGRKVRRSKTCATKREAQAAERGLLAERDDGKGVDATFKAFVEKVYWPVKEGLRADTKRCYRRDIDLRLMPAFGAMRVKDIDRLHIQRMLSACPTRKTATNARETLSSILGVAVEMEMLDRNPASLSYRYPKATERPADADGVWLGTFAEHRAVLEHVHAHDAGRPIERILVLGLCFGLRRGEVFGLDWEDVDLEHREVSIKRTYVCAEGGAYMDDPKTPMSRRIIPMTAWAAARVSEWRDSDGGEGASGPVVRSRRGTRMNPHTGSCCLTRYVDRNPVMDNGEAFPKVRVKSLRHSFATASIMAGVPVATVSRWLGHSQISTTYNRYVRPRLADLHASTAAIDEAFGALEGPAEPAAEEGAA